MKKSVKTTKKANAKKTVVCPAGCGCSTAHKIWGAVALAGLFACGLILGLTYRPSDNVRNSLDATQCDAIANEIVTITTAVENHPEIVSTCTRIEQLLERRLQPEDSVDYLAHLHNADTYSTLADRGCAENADMYKTLALRELEIAEALQPTEKMGISDAEIVIDTFKKLDMQREAQAFLDKVERLIDPATDFILQMEQIINE